MKLSRRPLSAIAVALGVLGIAACAPPPPSPTAVDVTIRVTTPAGVHGSLSSDGDVGHDLYAASVTGGVQTFTVHAVPVGQHVVNYDVTFRGATLPVGIDDYYWTARDSISYNAVKQGQVVDLTITPPSSEAVLSGHGTPGTYVIIETAADPAHQVDMPGLVAPDGTFQLRGVPAGSYRLYVLTPDVGLGPQHDIQLVAGPNTIDLR